jgi:hypothetical protein
MADPRIQRFRGPVAAFAVMVAVVMVTAAVLFARKVGLRAAEVASFYVAGGAAGRPRSLALHLVACAARARRLPFAVLSGVTFGCALAGITLGFAIRWVWPGLAAVKIAAFVGLEATMLLWLGLLVATVATVTPPARREAGPDEARAVPGPAR